MADPRRFFKKKPKKSKKLQQMQFLDTKEPVDNTYNTLINELNTKITVLEDLGNQFKLLYQKKVSEGQTQDIASTIISYNSDDIKTTLQKVRYLTLQLSANILQPDTIVKLGNDQLSMKNLPTYLENEIQRYSSILGKNPQRNDTSVAEKEEIDFDNEDDAVGDDAESTSLPNETTVSAISIVNSFTKPNTSSEIAEVSSEEENEKTSLKKSKSS